MYSSTITSRVRALALGAILPAALALAPADVRASGPCTDGAWADYNECLMNSGGFEWAKRECDIEFQAQYLSCFKGILKGFVEAVGAVM